MVVDVLGEVSEELSQEGSLFHSVLHEVDLSQIRSKGLHYLQVDDLTSINGFLAESEPVLAGGWSQLRVGSMVGGLASRVVAGHRGGEGEPPMEALERYTEGLLTSPSAASSGSIPSEMPRSSPWPGMPGSLETLSDLSSQYLLAKDGTLGFALVRIAKSNDGFASASEATDELRRLIDLVSARHPDVEERQIGPLRLDLPQGLFAVARDGYDLQLRPGLCQLGAQVVGQMRLVVGDQGGGHAVIGCRLSVTG